MKLYFKCLFWLVFGVMNGQSVSQDDSEADVRLVDLWVLAKLSGRVGKLMKYLNFVFGKLMILNTPHEARIVDPQVMA